MSRPQVRLNADEDDMVKYLIGRDNCEVSNPSELFRLLLHREYRRCKGLPAESFNKVASEMRVGRPIK